MFVKDSLEYVVRSDPSLLNDNIEILFLELFKEQIQVSRDVIIGVIYRPPSSSINVFTEELLSLLLLIRKINMWYC